MTGRETSLPPQVAGIWPQPAQVVARRSTPAGETGYLVVPSLRRPRYLVPTDVRQADRMLATHGGGRADQVARTMLRRMQRSGFAGRLPLTRLAVRPAVDGIEAYLAEALGRPIRIGVMLGPPRANLKPVIQVFDTAGTTIAFAKLGLTPLTRDLLSTEAAALSLLAGLTTRSFTAPALLHHGEWGGVPVLVQGALPLAQSDLAPRTVPVDVMVEIAALTGVERFQLADTDLFEEIAPGSSDGPGGVDLGAFRRLHAGLADAELDLGCWHGDFGPWNIGTNGRRTEVWDWERFGSLVPVGFDAAHYRTQRGVAAQAEPAVAWAQIVADVAAVLAASNLDPEPAPVVGSAYLLAIVSRYRVDAGSDPTSALRRRMGWLSRVAELAATELGAPADTGAPRPTHRQTGHQS